MSLDVNKSLLQDVSKNEKNANNLSDTHLIMSNLETTSFSTDINNHIVAIDEKKKLKNVKSISLTWRNICVNAPLKNKPNCLRSFFEKKFISTDNDSKLVQRPIIDKIDGIAKSNEILAIMGASGAGKTTFLNALNFRNKGKLSIKGEIRVNHHLVNSIEEIASISGYVQQDDLFVGCMTVKENLIFQAMLRMDKNYTMKERLQRVEEVMQDLNLKKCENTAISIADQKGISGGEKRRLAFASEILTDPMVLFCDEPTSGLDSFMAMSVVDSMKSLASKGKTIVCTIHQPSSEIFERFDKLCLLAEGRLAFIGNLSQAIDFFKTQNLYVPYNYNPADFYIRNLAISSTEKDICLERVANICNGFENSDLKEKLIQEIDESLKDILEKEKNEHSINFKEEIEYKTNIFTQMRWLTWRNGIISARNPMAFRVQIFQSIFIALMFGLIYFQLTLNQKGVQNISGVLFLCLTNSSFSSMFAVVNNFPSEIPIFLREHQNRMYRVISFYLSKMFIDVPTFTLIPVLFITIIYWMTNLSSESIKFLITVGIIVLVSQTAVSLGTFVSVCAPNTNAALALAGPIMVPLMIFSGFLLNTDDIPKYFLFLRYLSWFSYANENLFINQFYGVMNIACDNPNEECQKQFRDGEDVLSFYKIDNKNFYSNIGCLLVLIIGWRIMSFLVLLIKSKKQ